MSNSSLATYTKISPNKTSPRTAKIDTITIHCMAGQMTAKACADMFYNSGKYDTNKASSNYCVGYDGSIAVSVAESDRSWCSSNGTNDHRAITIEVASDSTSPYAVKDAAYKALIKLVADICKRNNIKKLVWSDTKTDRVNHKNGCNMTVHRDFANKACPGDYLMSKMSDIATQVNKALSSTTTTTTTTNTTTTTTTTKTTTTTTTKTVYRVRKSWSDASSQIGAYSSLANAKAACKEGYSVFDANGKAVYTVENSNMYYVRKTFKDTKTQLGAFSVLSNAKYFCNQYPGYYVFDKNGKQVAKSTAVLGDVDGDGKVTSADARTALNAATGKTKLDDGQKARADMDQDGKITAADSRAILNKAVGK